MIVKWAVAVCACTQATGPPEGESLPNSLLSLFFRYLAIPRPASVLQWPPLHLTRSQASLIVRSLEAERNREC
jgi:hypothetical protein